LTPPRATRCLGVALLFFWLGANAHAGSSADDDKVLPFTVQVPYGFLFLHLPALSAEAPPPRGWAFEAWTSVTNNFIYSDNVGDHLAMRTARLPVTEADFDAIDAASPGADYYYFDGEITTVYGRLATTVAPTFTMGARFSLISVNGGKGMDGFVEGFHSLFGLGQGYRDVVSKGETSAAIRIAGSGGFFDEDPRVGIGDPILYAIWSPDHTMGSWRVSLLGGVKVPVGSTSKRLSTGRADFGAAIAVTGELGRWCLNANAGVIVPGEIVFLPGVDPTTIVGFAGSVGYRFQETSLWVQLQWEQSPLRDATATTLSDDVFDVSIGVRFPVSGLVRGFVALTENVVAFENSSDIGFHAGAAWTFGAKPHP